MKGKIPILLILLIPLFLLCKERREYPCYLLPEAPVMDGREEKAWESIPEATGFFLLGGEKYAMEKQTYFKCGWTKEGIYFLIKCDEPSIEKLSARLNDGEELYREDSIELFFFPKDAPNYLHLAVNARGSRWNQIDATGQPATPWNWQAKSFVGKDFWSAEIFIPFEVLRRTARDGERWLINIARNIYTGPTSEHFTCWPPLRAGFHEVQNFAFLTFKERQLSLEEKGKIEEEINKPFYAFLKGVVEGLWRELEKESGRYREAISYGLGKEKLKEEANYLNEAWDELGKLMQREKPSLTELRSFIINYPNLPARFKEFNYKVLLEKLFE
ncbi:carbohydrate-binding family 9-like protein [bacterium]|nr:carbohydrate-binding family 9-like protein [bacterium]